MGELNDHLDEFAERLITIGGSPYSTLSEITANTKLNEQKGDYSITAENHIDRLLGLYQYLGKLYRDGISTAGKEDDPVTEDLFTGLKGAIDKNIWMLSSYLSKETDID